MSQKSTSHHIATVLFLECILGHYFSRNIVESSVPGSVSQSYDLWDALRRVIDPCPHALFIACGLSAIPMTAARAKPLERRHPQMTYANNALQREIRLCDYQCVCSSSNNDNGVYRVVFGELKSYIHVTARPSEESFTSGSW